MSEFSRHRDVSWPRCRFDRRQYQAGKIERPGSSRALEGVPILSVNTDEARRRAETLFKKEQQLREAQQAMTEYQAGLRMMREKTARLRALRLTRDAANNNKMRRPDQTRRSVSCRPSSERAILQER